MPTCNHEAAFTIQHEMHYSLSNSLKNPNLITQSVVTGTAFPGETLTSTRAGQWYADGVAISGETGATYVVGLDMIGKAIRCTNSESVTIWHPHDIAGVARFWSSLQNVYNSVSPNVAATNGQTVRRWEGIISGTEANQTTGTNQPIYLSSGQSGNPSLQFDGTNDYLSIGGTLSAFNNKSVGIIFVGCRDTNHTGGTSSHVPLEIRDGTDSRSRLTLVTRSSGASHIFAASTRVDGATTDITPVVSSNANYNVIAAEALWGAGTLNLRVNGAQASTTSISAGNSSATNSASNTIGTIAGFPLEYAFPGHICAVCLVNAAITTTERSQIERYIGLFGALNIPLV